MRRSILFVRTYGGMTGGHLKVWHYFHHVLSTSDWDARCVFAPESRLDEQCIWWADRDRVLQQFPAQTPDVLLLGGRDWETVDRFAPHLLRAPVINLVQHVRHAEPGTPRYHWLRRPAVRICVSPEVEHAVRKTGIANGPLVQIRSGLDLAELSAAAADTREIDCLILGVKNLTLAGQVAQCLSRAGLRLELVSDTIARGTLLQKLGRARVACVLPNRTEGFYLPALEAMATRTLTICPDCIGNRSFCRDGETCLMPTFEAPALAAAVLQALAMPAEARQRMLESAARVAGEHDLSRERAAFLAVLRQVG